MERLENFRRRFNLWVYGLDKDVEKGNPTEFTASFFKEVFKVKASLGQAEVETAHRIGKSGRSGLSAQDAILQIAKKERVLNFNGMKVKIFPDLTVETSKRRAQLKDLRMKRHHAGLKHGLIHPATLITFEEETKYFQDHQAEKPLSV